MKKQTQTKTYAIVSGGQSDGYIYGTRALAQKIIRKNQRKNKLHGFAWKYKIVELATASASVAGDLLRKYLANKNN